MEHGDDTHSGTGWGVYNCRRSGTSRHCTTVRYPVQRLRSPIARDAIRSGATWPSLLSVSGTPETGEGALQAPPKPEPPSSAQGPPQGWNAPDSQIPSPPRRVSAAISQIIPNNRSISQSTPMGCQLDKDPPSWYTASYSTLKTGPTTHRWRPPAPSYQPDHLPLAPRSVDIDPQQKLNANSPHKAGAPLQAPNPPLRGIDA